MKRHDLIAQSEQAGCYLIRRGGKHDIYHNPDTGKTGSSGIVMQIINLK